MDTELLQRAVMEYPNHIMCLWVGYTSIGKARKSPHIVGNDRSKNGISKY